MTTNMPITTNIKETKMNKLSIATLLISVALTTGCASQLQAAAAANTSAVVSVRAAADLTAKVNAEAFCTMSVDTLGRNQQYVKGVQTLCWSGSVTTPSDAAALIPAAVATQAK
jgi:hypothetical protein